MKEKKLKAYVAGKLNSDAVGYIQNMHKMIKVAKLLREIGVSVYVPANDFLEGLVNGNFTYEDYFENSQPWLEAADLVYVCPGWESSSGTAKEIDLARSIGKPIFFSIPDLLYAINHQSI